MVMVSFDFFKMLKWALQAGIRVLVNPIVWFPALVILLGAQLAALLLGIRPFFSQLVSTYCDFSPPQAFSQYVYGSDSNSISGALTYAFALDWVINGIFQLPAMILNFIYVVVSCAIVFYTAVLLNRFKGLAARWLSGIIPS